MANMNNADAIGALLGLGILENMLGNKPKEPKSNTFTDINKAVGDSAKNQKQYFDSLVSAGFTEEQAFQLVKTTLSNVKTVNITLK